MSSKILPDFACKTGDSLLGELSLRSPRCPINHLSTPLHPPTPSVSHLVCAQGAHMHTQHTPSIQSAVGLNRARVRSDMCALWPTIKVGVAHKHIFTAQNASPRDPPYDISSPCQHSRPVGLAARRRWEEQDSCDQLSIWGSLIGSPHHR